MVVSFSIDGSRNADRVSIARGFERAPCWSLSHAHAPFVHETSREVGGRRIVGPRGHPRHENVGGKNEG